MKEISESLRAFEEVTDNDIIKQIRQVRAWNNIEWMKILEIALKHAPEETKKVLREINNNDREISDLLGDLSNIP
jgi:Na+/serine symporter